MNTNGKHQGSRVASPAAGPPAISKKRAAFLKVAGSRLSNILQGIEYLNHACDPVRHEIWDEDIEEIRSKLRAATEDCIARYEHRSRKPVVKFGGME
jgi:hypothetical protein